VVADDTPVLVHNCGKPLIIGENMDRVRRYAAEVGGTFYRQRAAVVTKKLNTRMIQRYKNKNRVILDIGPDFARRTNGGARELYELERRLTKGYPLFRKVWTRTGKRSGGMAHWGEF
jgi:hypothetical protein